MDDIEREAGYAVGYRRPPKASRFKKGQSGNPKGRPPRSKDVLTLFNAFLDQRIEVQERGRRKNITIREAIIRKIGSEALKGNPKFLAMLVRIMREAPPDPDFAMTHEDESALNQALAEFANAGRTSGDDGHEQSQS